MNKDRKAAPKVKPTVVPVPTVQPVPPFSEADIELLQRATIALAGRSHLVQQMQLFRDRVAELVVKPPSSPQEDSK